jgi:hypothetical protein
LSSKGLAQHLDLLHQRIVLLLKLVVLFDQAIELVEECGTVRCIERS